MFLGLFSRVLSDDDGENGEIKEQQETNEQGEQNK